jgi:hypothetical protein
MKFSDELRRRRAAGCQIFLRKICRSISGIGVLNPAMNSVILFFSVMIMLSCESMPINYSRSQSWPVTNKKITGTVSLLGVTVDRIGGWDSVEKEITALAPLCFWEEGCQMIPAGKPADYAADIQLREREYSSGWRTKRSLSVEVRLWHYADAAEKPADTRNLPLAAGRIISTGDYTFSSFETTNRMLSQAIQKAVRQLPREKGGRDAK